MTIETVVKTKGFNLFKAALKKSNRRQIDFLFCEYNHKHETVAVRFITTDPMIEYMFKHYCYYNLPFAEKQFIN